MTGRQPGVANEPRSDTERRSQLPAALPGAVVPQPHGRELPGAGDRVPSAAQRSHHKRTEQRDIFGGQDPQARPGRRALFSLSPRLGPAPARARDKATASPTLGRSLKMAEAAALPRPPRPPALTVQPPRPGPAPRAPTLASRPDPGSRCLTRLRRRRQPPSSPPATGVAHAPDVSAFEAPARPGPPLTGTQRRG